MNSARYRFASNISYDRETRQLYFNEGEVLSKNDLQDFHWPILVYNENTHDYFYLFQKDIVCEKE